MTDIYHKAFAEVCVVLNYLNENDYNKIPKNIIDALEENRDTEYNFFIDESIPFYEQNLLEETKAILFNLYRDYLADSVMKEKIMQYQREEEYISEKIKQEKYKHNNMFEEKQVCLTNNNVKNAEQVMLVKYKNNFFTNIIKKIKKLWKSK